MRISKHFILREIVGDYIIVPVGETALEFNDMITVNETGALLWTSSQKETSEEKLAEILLEEYDVTKEEASKDVAEFLELLRKYKILE